MLSIRILEYRDIMQGYWDTGIKYRDMEMQGYYTRVLGFRDIGI